MELKLIEIFTLSSLFFKLSLSSLFSQFISIHFYYTTHKKTITNREMVIKLKLENTSYISNIMKIIKQDKKMCPFVLTYAFLKTSRNHFMKLISHAFS